MIVALVALPTSRNKSHPPGTVIAGTTIDDLQDCIVGMKHGDRTLHLSSMSILDLTSGGRNVDYLDLGGTGGAYLGIPLVVGDRLKSITFALWGPVSADRDLDIRLRRTTAAGVGTDLETLSIVNLASGWSDRLMTVDPQITVGAGEVFGISFLPTSNPNAIRIGGVRVVFDHP